MTTEERPTPETDKELENWDESPELKSMVKISRSLERERDDLREQLEHALNPVHSCGPDCKRVACVMRRELDKALESIETLEQRHAAVMLHTQSIVDDANEAREMAARLAELVEHIGYTSCVETRVIQEAKATLAAYETFAARVKK